MKKRFRLYLEFLIILALLAAYFNADLLLFSSLMGFILISLAYIWNRFVFAGLKIKKSLSKRKVDIGERVDYILEVENKKILPVLYLKVEDEASGGIQFANKSFMTVVSKQRNYFHDSYSLKWYEKVRRAYEIRPVRRGLYRFGPGHIYCKDIFGIFKNELNTEGVTELIVYPRIVPLTKLGLEAIKPFGSRMKDGWIYWDRLNRVGVRPYHITDDIRQINWKASARHLQLESDIYKPSFERDVHIFLNVHTGSNWWEGINRNALELSVICAASLVNASIEEGCQAGFYSNGGYNRNSAFTEIPPSKNPGQRGRIMTALAVLEPIRSVRFSGLLQREKSRIKPGSTVVIISPVLDEELEQVLSYYKKYYRLIFIGFDDRIADEKLTGIEKYFLNEEETWDEIEAFRLAN